MSIEPELVDKARTARAAFDEAERQALLARAEYHTAIRRLHLAGASVRDVAQALAISHQRVQQIVRNAGGSWWSRGWRARGGRPDAVCSWCCRPPSEVSKLIAGAKVHVCDACVAAAEATLAARPAAPFRDATRKSVMARCAFCGKRARKDRPVALAPSGHICADCVRVCREILGGCAA